jgi:hypothetical protein
VIFKVRCPFPPNPDPDLSGFKVWASEDSGFTPGDETLVADVPCTTVSAATSPTITALVSAEEGTTLYIRCAFYDAFGSDPSYLNFTDEISFTVPFLETAAVADRAINEIDITVDDDDVDMTADLSAAYGTWYPIVDLFWEAVSEVVLVSFTDDLSTSFSVSSGNTVRVKYLFEVYDDDTSELLASVENDQMQAVGFSSSYDTHFFPPAFLAAVGTTLGHNINFKVSIKRTRTSGGDSANATSQRRTTTVQQVKR